MDEEKKKWQESERKTKWDRENTVQVSMRLMKKGDADILEYLEGCEILGLKKQKELRRLIRAGIEAEKNNAKNEN